MDPGPPDPKRQRLTSWSSSSHGVSLPRPHSNNHTNPSPLPPPRAQHTTPYQPYGHRLTETHSGPATPVHPSTPSQSHPESDRRHHDQEPYAPMQEHYQHQHQHQHQPSYPPQHHPPPASPAAHGSYHQYPPRDPAVVKREPPVEDSHRPSSTAQAPDAPPPPHSSHHSLPPPQNYPDNPPRHMSYDHGHSVPPTPGGYRASSYPQPPPTPVSQQPSYDSHSNYSESYYSTVAYSSNAPAKKKNTRASQACDQCRQLKAKCDETKPCKTCRDKNLECKYRDPVPKATDKAQADILDAIQMMQSTLNSMSSRMGRMDDRFTKIEEWAQNGPQAIKPDPVMEDEMKTRVRSPPLANGNTGEQYYDPSRDIMQPVGDLAPMRMMAAEDATEAEPGPPVPPGEPAIPHNHTTLAGLLLDWPSIRELTKHHLHNEGIHYISEFPISHEQNRGPLLVYGRGEASHSSRMSREPTDHGNVDMADDASDIASPSPGADFGQLGGLSPPDMIEYKGGVLGLDGNPDFTPSKVWSYVQSFKSHILNMHPIVQPNALDYWVRHFLETLPPTQPRSAKPQVAKPTFAYASTPHPSIEQPGIKRKRTPDLDGSDGPATPAPRAGRPNRSIHSALILTVLALGKICQHRENIPDVVHTSVDAGHLGSPMVRNGMPQSPGRSSPPSHSSHSHSAQPSPRDPVERGSQSRRPSIHGSTGTRGYSLKKNYEVIPGLEYFAYATDILGNLAGAYNNIKDVYANIFASLYYGQLNRPLESFAFIHKASHKLQVIMRPSLDRLRTLKRTHQFIKDHKYNELALAFWTCLQLESDLIAELPLPPSGLLSYEDDMPHPNMSLLQGFDQQVLDSYPGQLYLRTHLNSIHRMFYAPEDPNKPGQDKFKNVGLVADAVSTMHWVARSFAFKEDDPPGKDILSARLRAKYWGAQMITYRPFIRQILQLSHSINHSSSSPNPPIRTEFREDIIVPTIHPGTKSLKDIDEEVVLLASKGIKALIESTRAFHGLGEERPIITNVFGTAHAQWGNLLVLSAAFRDPVLRKFIDEDLLRTLFQRTIHFLRQSATATSALRVDLHILEGLQRDLFMHPEAWTTSSFSSHNSMHTPKIATSLAPMQPMNSTPT